MVQLVEQAQHVERRDASEEAVTERVRRESRRLQAVLDRVSGSSGGLLDPMLLRQVVEVINGGVLEAAEDYDRMLRARWQEEGFVTSCSTSCWVSDLHCPTSEPLLPLADELRVAGFEPYQDEVEERVAHEMRCICGQAMSYLGLHRGRQIKAWAMCPDCGHWLPL